MDDPGSSGALWGEHSATEAILWTRRHLEANPEYELHFNEPWGHLLFEVKIASPMKLPQKWSLTPVQAMKVRAVSLVLQSLRQLGALSAWQVRRKHVCPLSQFCGDVLSGETERECQETSLLLCLLKRRDLLCPCWWKVMQTSHCPPLTDLHGENFVGQASVAPK